MLYTHTFSSHVKDILKNISYFLFSGNRKQFQITTTLLTNLSILQFMEISFLHTKNNFSPKKQEKVREQRQLRNMLEHTLYILSRVQVRIHCTWPLFPKTHSKKSVK
jgi:hypothetical protein